jgi:hypothetical protein
MLPDCGDGSLCGIRATNATITGASDTLAFLDKKSGHHQPRPDGWMCGALLPYGILFHSGVEALA